MGQFRKQCVERSRFVVYGDSIAGVGHWERRAESEHLPLMFESTEQWYPTKTEMEKRLSHLMGFGMKQELKSRFIHDSVDLAIFRRA